LVKFSLATGGRFTLTPSLGSDSQRISLLIDMSLKTRFFDLHYCRRKYRCMFNHFYVGLMCPRKLPNSMNAK